MPLMSAWHDRSPKYLTRKGSECAGTKKFDSHPEGVHVVDIRGRFVYCTCVAKWSRIDDLTPFRSKPWRQNNGWRRGALRVMEL